MGLFVMSSPLKQFYDDHVDVCLLQKGNEMKLLKSLEKTIVVGVLVCAMVASGVGLNKAPQGD